MIQDLQPLLCFLRFGRGQKDAVRLMFPAAHAASELVELRQAKALGILNQNDRSR